MAKWLLLVLLSSVVPAFATEILIDFSNLVSTTPGNWNNVSDLTGTTSNLIDFGTGLGTGVSIAGSANWQDFYGDDAGVFPNQSWLVQPATQDGAGLQQDLSGTFTLSGLTGSAYTIELVSARPEYGYLNTFTVNGAYAGSTYLGTPVVTPWNSTTDGLDAGNWLIWNDVVPVGGEITIQDVAGPDTLGILNAMRLSDVVAAPEPATLTFTAIGLAMLCLLRRRYGPRSESHKQPSTT